MVEGMGDGEGTVGMIVRVMLKNAMEALAGRFQTKSKQGLYLMEFQSPCKKWMESWVEFVEDLSILAYPMLEDDMRQQLVLQCYSSQCIMIKLPLEIVVLVTVLRK